MKQRKKSFVRVFAAALCIIFSGSLCGCTNNTDINVKPDISVTSDVTEAVTEILTESEPEVTEPEPETVVRKDISSVRKKAETYDDVKYSSLSDYEACYNVTDSYYQIDFLDDKLFEAEINEDIKEAVKELRKSYDESYSRQASRSHSSEVMAAKGIVADIICRNGFLSVLLEYGYTEPYGTVQAGGYSPLLTDKGNIRFDHAVTLNYELTTKNKITDFSELFYSDTDWKSTVTNAIFKEYKGNVAFLPEEKPELFTVDYILIKTSDDDYAAVRYNSSDLNLAYCSDMISSHFAPMNDVTSLCSETYYETYSSVSLETCGGCNMNFIHMRADTSRFYSDAEIASLNAELEMLYDRGFAGRENHECYSLRSNYGTVIQCNPDYNKTVRHMNIWSYTDKYDNMSIFNPYTHERVDTESVIGYNWLDYAESTDPDMPDISSFALSSLKNIWYSPAEKAVRAELFGFSPVYETDITVRAIIPADNIPSDYLCD